MATLKDNLLYDQQNPRLQLEQDKNMALKDCCFLAGVTLLLQGFIIWNLGFYSDDWAFLAIFHNAPDKSLVGLINSFFTEDQNARMRPIQIINLATLYWLFDTQPLGYHITNSLVIASVIVLFYLSLRQLKLPRILLMGIPLIFALLPHFSTDRIWMATFQTNISIFYFFLNFIAISQSINTKGKKALFWGAISLISVGLSILAYEVVLPLFLISFSVFLWGRKTEGNFLSKASDHKFRIILLSNVFVFVLCIVFKALISSRTGGFYSSYWDHLLYVFASVIKNDFYVYGLNFPKIIWQIFSNYFNYTLLSIGIPLGVVIFIYLQRLHIGMYKPSTWLKVIIAGTVLYGAGYAIFLTTAQFMVHPTGLANRITMAASIGVATCFLGAIGLTYSLIPSVHIKKYLLSASISCLGTLGFMINYTIATFYHKAFPVQLEILDDIHQSIPVLSEETVLLIDGICPFVGPAPVFECYWDVTGALRILYDLKQVRGDVRRANFRYTDEGIITTIYGEETFYPFNENLIVYNHQTKQTTALHNTETANEYFENSKATASNTCPYGKEGYGVRIFNL